MKILYDYSAFVMQARGGVSRVLYELFRHVAETKGIECRLFAGFHRNQYLKDAPPDVRKNIVGRYLPEWMVKQRIFMPINRGLFRLYASRFQPDICHYTYFDTPRVPAGCRVVITMHDMIHELFPDLFGSDDPHTKWKKQALARADGVVCVSENTRRDLEHYVDISGKMLSVIHHGNSLASVVPERVDYPHPYFLYVGTRQVDYKNFDLVLKAIAKCRDKTGAHLICFGGGVLKPAERKKIEALGLNGRIHQVGGNDALLAGYYTNALALVYPSKYEGFGLPPIEAMGCGCPVIVAHALPMPEVIGEAGLYFDPESETGLENHLMAMSDAAVRSEWSEKAKYRAQKFLWDQSARQAVAFYDELVRERTYE